MFRRISLIALAVGMMCGPLLTQAGVTQPTPLLSPDSTAPDFSADELVSWVLQRNPGLQARAAAIDVAVHRIEPAGSLDDPSFSYSFAPRTFGREGQGLNQKIEFGQPLPWPGTLKARRTAASHHATAVRESEQSLRLELTAKAKAAFAELFFIQRALAIHHGTHALLGELRSGAEARYVAGKSSQGDVLQAELELANLDRHLLELNRIETEVVAQINGLLNRAPSRPLPNAGEITNLHAVPALEDLEQLAQAHPELKRLDAEISASSSEVTLAEKAFYPDLRVVAGYNSLWDDPDKRGVIGLSINIPLDRGKRREVLAGAKAYVHQVESQRANEAAQLLAELARAHAALVEARASVTLHQQSLLPLARAFLQATLADYRSGRGSFLSVITAERQKLKTEEDLERSRADVLRQFAELELWTGIAGVGL